MLAYHNDPELKLTIMAKLAAHRAADEIVKGRYWDGHKGCAVGCVLEDPDGGHMRYESEFRIPAQLAYLEDHIFESLPMEKSILWPERFMGAIPVGADLSKVWPKFAVWLMVDEEWGLVNIAEVQDVKGICRRVADGYTRGTPLSDEDVEALRRDAWDAWAAAAAAAARDVWDAWDAWAAAAARDAWDAWDVWDARAAAAAAAAARDVWDAWDAAAAWVLASSDKLIELLADCDSEAVAA